MPVPSTSTSTPTPLRRCRRLLVALVVVVVVVVAFVVVTESAGGGTCERGGSYVARSASSIEPTFVVRGHSTFLYARTRDIYIRVTCRLQYVSRSNTCTYKIEPNTYSERRTSRAGTNRLSAAVPAKAAKTAAVPVDADD
ncbi:hypothetical protein V1477_017956 [Vespula maculifrons]|uniref:Uncharacterized protein n=1 Tax=Vespula maculifrons TaxID=7453 RepID=A0ABD2B0R3_VESMC